MAANPSRTTAWSSAIKIRMGSGIWRSGNRHDDDHARAMLRAMLRARVRLSADIDLPAHLAHALPYARDTKTGPTRLAHAATVVFHLQHHRCRLVSQTDANAISPGMANRVGQSFLGNPEEVGLANFI